MMIGGEATVVKRLDPIFATLAPGMGGVARTPGRENINGTAELGYLHCGPNGAGHFVKMVHNGIEYGIMSAYSEGLGILRAAEHYQYDLNLRDVAEVWRRGSVIASWLLDLTATALVEDPNLSKFAGRVSDSGEGRWTIKAAIDEAVPAPVLTSALYERFSSRGKADVGNELLSACDTNSGGTWKNPKANPKWLKEMIVANSHSDAFVFFGATGDLAYKKIFPALQAMGINVMAPDEGMAGQLAEMIASHQPTAEEMDAYERVLGDAMAADATLFAREDYVEEAWRIVDPLLNQASPVYAYEPNSWGPNEVERVMPAGNWHNPVISHDQSMASGKAA
jgi:hypothetical protein